MYLTANELSPGGSGYNACAYMYMNLYISLTLHHYINQFVITNLMHICFIS
jgi:hypothetical protein